MFNGPGLFHIRASGLLRFHFLTVLSVLLLASCHSPQSAGPKPVTLTPSSGHAVLVTDQGPIEIEFFANDAPKAVENFRLLAQRGYYNGLTFHRIVRGFMIQGGDPVGDGSGGQSAWGGTFADEIQTDSALYIRGYRRGIVAMANSGPNTNGSQFFIMLQDYPLPPNYVIFGQVTKGMDAVDAMGSLPVTMGPGGEMSRPVVPPVIRKATILP